MPSTFSPALRIELIGSGEQVGVWGNTTNNNLGDLVEQAITGATEINVTAADVTLTALNGVTDQARSAVLIVTGTAGVTRVITIPNANKTYTVKNRSNATVQIKTSGGTAFDVPTLSESYVYCNGLNVITGRVITDGANAITSLAAPFASPAFTGTPTAPTASLGTSTTQIATTAFVNAEIASDTANLAPLNSPALTGVPTAPTASVGTNTTQLATTAFVNAEIANDAPTKTGTGASGTWGINITGNAATATNATNAVTQAAGTNNTTIATTAFVTSAIQTTVPTGVILMWSGSIASIPAGWLLCNGTGGTPDLQDRFVVGAGSTYVPGNTGGADTVTLTTAQIPSHIHSISGSGNTGDNNVGHFHGVNINSGNNNVGHSHTASGSTDTVNVDHSHSGTTGGNNVGHAHTFSAATDSQGLHSHGINDPGHAHSIGYTGNLGYSGGGGNPNTFWGAGTNQSTNSATTGITTITNGAHNHSVSGTTSAQNADHVHGFSTGVMSANAAHAHTFSVTTSTQSANHIHNVSGNTGTQSANHIHSFSFSGTSGATGSGTAHENRPPYYALAYIMKT